MATLQNHKLPTEYSWREAFRIYTGRFIDLVFIALLNIFLLGIVRIAIGFHLDGFLMVLLFIVLITILVPFYGAISLRNSPKESPKEASEDQYKGRRLVLLPPDRARQARRAAEYYALEEIEATKNRMDYIEQRLSELEQQAKSSAH